MKIVFLTETFSRKMGYITNCLPKEMSLLEEDVAIITIDLLPYYTIKDFSSTYNKFFHDDVLTPGTKEVIDGVELFVLGHKRFLGHNKMVGLYKLLRVIKPDVVQTFAAIGWIPLEAAIYKYLFGYKLFTGSHYAASMFPLAKRQDRRFTVDYMKKWTMNFFTRFLPGFFVSCFSEKCYVVTCDCEDIAQRYFGVPKYKTILQHLGVDDKYFFQNNYHTYEIRSNIRKELGVCVNDILCIYTGKMTEEKNPLIIAQAIMRLRSYGYAYRGIFIGEGIQRNTISGIDGCTGLGFINYRDLGKYYQSSDIAIWPSNESTSMLDAAACGLPLIISDEVVYRDHVEGNGVVFQKNNIEDLIQKMLIFKDADKRMEYGLRGAKKMKSNFCWRTKATERISEYQKSIHYNNDK